jgi:hypothetical protein
MGVAAYNRGSALLAREIREEYIGGRGKDWEVFEDLTGLSASLPGGDFGAESGIRLDSAGRFWLMNRLDDGWGEYGVPYSNLREIAKSWRLWFVGWSVDRHGPFIAVSPLPKYSP